MVDRIRRRTHFLLARDGATAVEFAFILIPMILLTLVVLEVALVMFDYHRAGEAMRTAVRAFEVGPAAALDDPLPITCGSDAACDTGRINAVLTEIQATFPKVQLDNLLIEYTESQLGIADAGGVVTPVITVSIVNLQHDFFILSTIVPLLPPHLNGVILSGIGYTL